MDGPDAREAAPLTLFGWDIYIVVFVAIGGAMVLLAIVWIFFTNWPMPRICGGAKTSHICGWISRDPPHHAASLTPPALSV